MKPSPYPEDIQRVCRGGGTAGSIYIGNIEAAKNPRLLRKHSIKAIVSVARGAFLDYSSEELPNYLYIPAQDHQNYNLDVYFDKTYDFIHKNLKRTNILVHCVAGVSRSASIVIAYLMRREEITFDEAFNKISLRRSIINPNSGFIRQLKMFQKTLRLSSVSNLTGKGSLTSFRSTEKAKSPDDTAITAKSQIKNRSLDPSKKSKRTIQEKIKTGERSQLTLEYQIQRLKERYFKPRKADTRLKTQICIPKLKTQKEQQSTSDSIHLKIPSEKLHISKQGSNF